MQSGRPVVLNLVGWSYFPFFGPFLSSFLPFFFIRFSFSDLADDGRLRPPSTVLSYTVVCARVKKIYNKVRDFQHGLETVGRYRGTAPA